MPTSKDANTPEDKSRLISYYETQANADRQNNDLESAKTNYIQALALAQDAGNVLAYRRTLYNLGQVEVKLQNYDSAEASFKQVLASCANSADETSLAACQSLNELCAMYWKQGKYDEALQCQREAVDRANRSSEVQPFWRNNFANNLRVLETSKRTPSKEQPAVPARIQSNEELARIVAADQAERTEVDFSKLSLAERAQIAQRDAERREQVIAIVAAGEARTADDFFNAALVLQHGTTPEDFIATHMLATLAMSLNHPSGKWLTAASLDRLLQTLGQKQAFATQLTKACANSPWQVAPCLGTLLFVALRKAYNVPSLTQMEQRAKEMNKKQ